MHPAEGRPAHGEDVVARPLADQRGLPGGGQQLGGVEGDAGVADTEDVGQAFAVGFDRFLECLRGGEVARPVAFALAGEGFDLSEQEAIDAIDQLGSDVAGHRQGAGSREGASGRFFGAGLRLERRHNDQAERGEQES
jgi:hypothetical protein